MQEWKCPRCGEGEGILVCNCDESLVPSQMMEHESHGISHGNPCYEAGCECGWGGKLPTGESDHAIRVAKILHRKVEQYLLGETTETLQHILESASKKLEAPEKS